MQKNDEEFMIYSKAVQIKEVRAAVSYLLCYPMVMQPRIISIYVEHFNFYTVQAIIDDLGMLLEADLILVRIIMFCSVTNTLVVFRCSILMCCVNMGIHWSYYLIMNHIIMIEPKQM